jgi:Holliday junction resolvase-like predicted endonuclease
MIIKKSSRHSKITGDFAENMVLYWLSKYGFECTRVDHTGIDLLARNDKNGELMGISVKSRSRNEGKEGQYLSIPNENFKKVDDACIAFGCNPYFAIVVDEESSIKVYILSQIKLLQYFPMKNKVSGWKMTKTWQQKYNEDKDIVKIEFEFGTKDWWE